MNNRGTALCWALKARDAEICSKIAEYELECFHSTETWSIPALVDAMENNSNNIYSEKLLFLSKYKQVSNKKQQCVRHLNGYLVQIPHRGRIGTMNIGKTHPTLGSSMRSEL